MNIKSLIRNELWLAISNTYEAENYSPAVLDAVHYLSDVIREKSGLDGDGQNLVSAAFGRKSPILRINKLQTETERDEQKGFEQILRGLYQGIRNPRSHEQVKDDKNTADAIIYFVNYLLGIIGSSQEPFTIVGFVDRVFDTHFVNSPRYAELLVSEIPHSKYLDVLIELYRSKLGDKGKNIALVVKEILEKLSQEQIPAFVSFVSEELKVTQNRTDIRLTLQMLPPELWKLIDPAAKMRTENMIIKSIEEGSIDLRGDLTSGGLGTWAGEFLQYFELRSQAGNVLRKKLNGNHEEQFYVFNFFLSFMPQISESEYCANKTIKAICKGVKEEDPGSPDLLNCLRNTLWKLPEDWCKSIKEELPDIDFSDEGDIPF